MFRERNKIIIHAHKTLDICLTAAAFIGAYHIKKSVLPEPFRGLLPTANYELVFLLIVIIWYLIFHLFGVQEVNGRRSFGKIVLDMVKSVSFSMLILSLCIYLLKITDVSRIMMGTFFLINMGLLAFSKSLIYWVSKHHREIGCNSRNILVIGSKKRAKDVIETIEKNSECGFRIVGCVDIDDSEKDKVVKNQVKVIGRVDELKNILVKNVVDEVILAMPLSSLENARARLAAAEELGVAVRIIPDLQIFGFGYKPDIATIKAEEFMGIPTFALTTTPTNEAELLLKNAFDYLFAVLTILLLFPLFLIIAVAIKFFSKGPVFFRQERCGLNGRKFMLYKFRTMVADAEKIRMDLETANEADGPVFKIKKDPRIIPIVGSFLRRTGLDELPQLINMLRGEMSLVGPRPPLPDEVSRYDIWQRRRLSMKPGITCLWQCAHNRHEVGFAEWMKMDLSYIDKWSLKLDFKILLKTAWVMLLGEGR